VSRFIQETDSYLKLVNVTLRQVNAAAEWNQVPPGEKRGAQSHTVDPISDLRQVKQLPSGTKVTYCRPNLGSEAGNAAAEWNQVPPGEKRGAQSHTVDPISDMRQVKELPS
jgi:hypothetical protein